MRLAVISDIHANVDALRAVLADARAQGARHVLSLGDLVGYNAFPRETLELMQERQILSVHGNHDLMAIDRLPLDRCGPLARQAIVWTREVLTDDDRRYLAALPGELRQQGTLLCVHSVPGDPVTRLTQPAQFAPCAELLGRTAPEIRVCFTGHTHLRDVVIVREDGPRRRTGDEERLPRDALCFVNPGSVGYPRTRDPRACYALFDCDEWRVTFRRVRYDRAPLLRANRRVGLHVPSAIQLVAARMFRHARR